MRKLSATQPTACVVIPYFRTELRAYEQISLARCFDILGTHAITLIVPSSLKVDSTLASRSDLAIETFSDDFFEGVAGYNRLMLSDEFYARFEKFDYMLIYQLDAFVFSDQLLAWCKRGYDYIGAPWFLTPQMPTPLDDIRISARRLLYRWINRPDHHNPGIHHAQYMYSVGNGGFSLRKVAAMRESLAALPSVADRYRDPSKPLLHEDMFFSVEANRYLRRVKTPSYREAVGFAWELQPALAAKLNGGNLPFGCHAWNKTHRSEWTAIFSKLGYSLDDILSETSAS
jgi:hypothetical protein